MLTAQKARNMSLKRRRQKAYNNKLKKIINDAEEAIKEACFADGRYFVTIVYGASLDPEYLVHVDQHFKSIGFVTNITIGDDYKSIQLTW